MKSVDGGKFFPFDFPFKFDRGFHVAHILHGDFQVLTRKPCLERVIHHGLLAHPAQCPVDPLRGVLPCHDVCPQWNLEK